MSDAYHLRLELLSMAKQMLENDYFGQREQISSNWSIEVQTAEKNGEVPPKHPTFPAYPSTDAIITKAKELNKFISER